jgi:NifU-like protein involved in Fe-S cluster formation
MDEVIAQNYRRLVEEGFKHAGNMESPSVFFDSKAEGVSVCGDGGKDYVNFYLKIEDDVIDDIKYLCSCDPAANVAVEAMCELCKGKSLRQARAVTKEDLFAAIGTSRGLISRKVWGVLELFNLVIKRYESPLSAPSARTYTAEEDFYQEDIP